MAHYAIVDENNVVTTIISGAEEDSTPPTGFDNWEAFYTDFMGATALRCSWNTYKGEHKAGGTAFRGNYPAKGWIYNASKDVFHIPQFHDSWTLDDHGVWNPPTAMPLDGKPYIWDEDNTEWVRDTNIADEDLVELPDL